jgi:hypothetical protein
MAGITTKPFSSPDETRTPPNTTIEVVRLGGATAARFTFQPGWRWSQDVGPVVGTASCQTRHVGAVHAGTLHLVHEDGTEVEVSAGDAYVIEPGHDGWVVGDEPFVGLEFESAEDYGKA